MSLESIIEHILTKARRQAEAILQEAGKQAQGIVLEAKQEAEDLFQGIIRREGLRYENQKKKIIVQSRLQSRKDILKLKQELVEAVFTKLQSELKSDRFKKEQVLRDKTKEVPEDIGFYLEMVRRDYETQIAKILFE